MLLEGPHNSRIDPVELRMPAFSHAQSGFKRREPECQKSIFKNVDIPGYGRPGHARVPGKARNIDHLPVEQGGNREKSGETGEVADDRLGLDFLFEIQLYVSAEGFLPGVSLQNDWKAAVLQDCLQREILTQLLGDKRVHGTPERTAREQVGS